MIVLWQHNNICYSVIMTQIATDLEETNKIKLVITGKNGGNNMFDPWLLRASIWKQDTLNSNCTLLSLAAVTPVHSNSFLEITVSLWRYINDTEHRWRLTCVVLHACICLLQGVQDRTLSCGRANTMSLTAKRTQTHAKNTTRKCYLGHMSTLQITSSALVSFQFLLIRLLLLHINNRKSHESVSFILFCCFEGCCAALPW